MNFSGLNGRFYRIIFKQDLGCLLHGVRNPEGRFHHDGEPALYLSPNPEAAAVAIDSYYRAGDPARVIAPLRLSATSVLDFRENSTSQNFGLTGDETSANWRNERRAGKLASSWRASDAARAAGARGMVYYSRKAPPHWHLVLFHWNTPNTPKLVRDGAPLAFNPDQ